MSVFGLPLAVSGAPNAMKYIIATSGADKPRQPRLEKVVGLVSRPPSEAGAAYRRNLYSPKRESAEPAVVLNGHQGTWMGCRMHMGIPTTPPRRAYIHTPCMASKEDLVPVPIASWAGTSPPCAHMSSATCLHPIHPNSCEGSCFSLLSISPGRWRSVQKTRPFGPGGREASGASARLTSRAGGEGV